MRPPNSAPQGGRAPAADFAAGPSAAAANVTQQVIADLEPPSVDDLFALYRLCGGDESKVIELLSRMWGTQPEAIAPTVRVWLGGLPAQYKPPSRSRTAPPALPSWFLNVPGLPQLGHANPGLGRSGPIVLPNGVKPPPVSAPAAQGNKGNKEMGRTFDMLMLQKAVENGNARLPNRKDKPQNRLALQPMPEEGPVSFSAPQWQGKPSLSASLGGGGAAGMLNRGPAGKVPAALGDDALGAFMYASRMGKGIGVTEAVSRGYGGRHMR